MELIFREPLFKQYSKGQIETTQFYQAFTKQYNLDISFSEFSSYWCEIFAPMKGMESLVNQVAASCKIGLLSDIDPLHWAYLIENYPFLKDFPRPVLSYQIGALKPSPKCYRAAAESVGESPAACLFIDDRRINILGARKLGMRAVLFKDRVSLKTVLQHYQIIT